MEMFKWTCLIGLPLFLFAEQQAKLNLADAS